MFSHEKRLNIQYDLKLKFGMLKNFAEKLGVMKQSLSGVIRGVDRSQYIEAETAKAIGWDPWEGIPAKRRTGRAAGSRMNTTDGE